MCYNGLIRCDKFYVSFDDIVFSVEPDDKVAVAEGSDQRQWPKAVAQGSDPRQ